MTGLLVITTSKPYTTAMATLVSNLRRLRLRRDLTQARLAARVGISRQALGAIEREESVPSVEVALRLAATLGVSVEALFGISPPDAVLDAVPAGELGTGARVRIARVDGSPVAVPVEGSGGPGPGLATGIVVEEGAGHGPRAEETGTSGARVRLRRLAGSDDGADGGRVLILAGCDPATALVQELLQRRRGIDLLWTPAGSHRALEALSRGVAHVAGFHLKDEEARVGGSVGAIRARLPFPCTVVTFAVWEQGLLIRPGAGGRIKSVSDLGRGKLRLVNREEGSGSRAVLDRALRRAGLDGADIPGYADTSAPGHWAVAQAVAAGTADAGVGIRAAAAAFRLDWVLLEEERYDLVIPDHLLDDPAVGALLELLESTELRRQVESLEGYDVAPMGRPA